MPALIGVEIVELGVVRQKLDEAEKLIAEGRYQAVIDMLSPLTKLPLSRRDLKEVYFCVGRAYASGGQLKAGDAYYAKASEFCDPNEDQRLLLDIDTLLTPRGNHAPRVKIIDKLLTTVTNRQVLLTFKARHLNELLEAEQLLQTCQTYLNEFPPVPEIYELMALAYRTCGQPKEIIECHKFALALHKAQQQGIPRKELMSRYSIIIMTSAYDQIYDREQYKRLIAEVKSEMNPEAERCFKRDLSFFKRLKIGYLSSDLRHHPIGMFMYPVFKHRNRHENKVNCYNMFSPPKAKSISMFDIDLGKYFIEQADSWQNTFHMSDERITKLILRDELDIAFDLNSHSAGNKLPLFAERLAPVQITYLGLPTTTGIGAMDYALVDRYTDPEGAEEQYTEKLLRMSRTSLCHELVHSIRPQSEPPCTKNGYVTFGNFSNILKYSKKCLRLYAGVLAVVKDARLLLTIPNLNFPEVERQMRKRLEENGIDLSRVTLEDSAAPPEYEENYGRVDIVLDTVPFNGATTTCDALSMGVPVVTLAGETQAARRGMSILLNVGLGSLVAYDEREFIEIARCLAADMPRIVYYRKNLRQMKAGSALGDGEAFTREYEHLLRRAWIDYCIANSGTADGLGHEKSGMKLLEEMRNGANYILFGFDGITKEVLAEYLKLESKMPPVAGYKPLGAATGSELKDILENNLSVLNIEADKRGTAYGR